MNNALRVHTLRELCEEQAKANNTAKIFLKAARENHWLIGHYTQVDLVISILESAEIMFNLDFIQEVINPEE